MAEAFARLKLPVDAVVSSPLVRAHQTAVGLLSVWQPGVRPVTYDALAPEKLKPNKLSEFFWPGCPASTSRGGPHAGPGGLRRVAARCPGRGAPVRQKRGRVHRVQGRSREGGRKLRWFITHGVGHGERWVTNAKSTRPVEAARFGAGFNSRVGAPR